MVLGDPAGIGPELVARLFADPAVRQAADVVLVAERDELLRGMEIAGVRFPYVESDAARAPAADSGGVTLFGFHGSVRGPFARAVVSEASGRYCLETLGVALDLARHGRADALCFAPLNKGALRAAGMNLRDELHWFAEVLGHPGPVCEFNVVDGLWTSRVTSHVPLSEVATLITGERVIEAIRLIHDAVRRSGVERPRIAVCGLNPHNGDNGAFGREEIDIIGPAVERAKAQGFDAHGPFPADTIFLRVFGGRRDFDAVVTMYHDQGQIALKLTGFSRGVTVQGGLPIPITTPASGTAFDIAGQGRANADAMRLAFELACRMGSQRRVASGAAPTMEPV